MKWLADLDALAEDGVLSPGQAAEIKRRAKEDMVALVVNIVLFAGIAAVIGGTAAWLKDLAALVALGAVVTLLGAVALRYAPETYRLLSNAIAVIGSVTFVGGGVAWIVAHFDSLTLAIVLGLPVAAAGYWLWSKGPGRLRFLAGWLTVLGVTSHLAGVLLTESDLGLEWLALHYAGAVVIACGLALDVRFITALSIVPLAAALSSRVLYSHAAYTIAVYESTLTVLQLGLLAAACALLAPRLAERWARHVRIIGQLAFIWVNVAFWVGSLWGDVVGTYLWGPRLEDFMAADQTGKARDMGAAMEAFREAEAAFRESALVISVDVYSLVWAALILAVGAWAASTGRRPVFNTAVTFGAIHLYTQWFERLEATPGMVTLAGLIAIAAAYAIWRINLWLRDRAAAA